MDVSYRSLQEFTVMAQTPYSTYRPSSRRSSSKKARKDATVIHFENADIPSVFVEDDVDEGPPIPTVNERLGHLRPSRELLEYYRRKIAEFDGEHQDMMKKLDQYKTTYERQHKMQWDLRQREEEIAELQKALSDMQVYLFQEREQVLRLYAENDRLKIRELEDRKRIQHLLALNGPGEPEVTYFHKEPPARAVVKQHHPTKRYPHPEGEKLGLQSVMPLQSSSTANVRAAVSRPTSAKPAKKNLTNKKKSNENVDIKEKQDVEVLLLQIEALQSQMADQARVSKDQVDALIEDRRVRMEEMQTVIERDQSKVQALEDRLHQTQNLLYDSTRDYLQLKYESRAEEKRWMGEKDKLLQELDRCKEQLNVSKDDVLHVSDHALEQRQAQTIEIEALENQLQQAQKLSDMYREQVITLESELAAIREKEDVSKEAFKGRTEKLSRRLQLMNQRYEALEKRRNLEVEGFKNDIKTLRGRLKDVEKQLFKVTLGFGEDGDMRMLRDVHTTAKKSKEMQGELHRLKAMIYGMENDIRRL
ncbi:coiled-coil domain-containing protein 77-like [Lytechinus pictus]|uniref:coiled-coil domain-containing protein 77-like n=1 Tax=Lytechinus pictus TaxID=7653 RepID=UPI00240CFC56|nr:coiled-coil domain-containing protein 77-like [Lytechinus pictus]